jgi:hypothetical protein
MSWSFEELRSALTGFVGLTLAEGWSVGVDACSSIELLPLFLIMATYNFVGEVFSGNAIIGQFAG